MNSTILTIAFLFFVYPTFSVFSLVYRNREYKWQHKKDTRHTVFELFLYLVFCVVSYVLWVSLGGWYALFVISCFFWLKLIMFSRAVKRNMKSLINIELKTCKDWANDHGFLLDSDLDSDRYKIYLYDRKLIVFGDDENNVMGKMICRYNPHRNDWKHKVVVEGSIHSLPYHVAIQPYFENRNQIKMNHAIELVETIEQGIASRPVSMDWYREKQFDLDPFLDNLSHQVYTFSTSKTHVVSGSRSSWRSSWILVIESPLSPSKMLDYLEEQMVFMCEVGTDPKRNKLLGVAPS